MVPPGVVAVNALAVPLGFAVAIAAVWLFHERAIFPVILVGSLETAAVNAFGVSNPGHPTFAAFPNACSFASCSSSFEAAGGVCAGSSIAVIPTDDSCSHSSNLTVSLHKRMGHFDSRSNLRHSAVSDTSALPTDATTSHCRKRCPHPGQGLHRHTSQAALPPLEVRQIRWVEAQKC